MFNPLTEDHILLEIAVENEAASRLDRSANFEQILRHISNAGKIADAGLSGKPFNVARVSGVVMIERQVTLFGMRASKIENIEGGEAA